MDDALTAHGAAALGALGAVLLLTGRTRFLLLAGYASLGLSQLGLALSLAGGIGGSVGPATVAAGLAGLAVVGALAAVLVRWPALALPALLLAAPFRLPLDIDRSHRFLFAVAESGELGRLLPLYVILTAACARVISPFGRKVAISPAISKSSVTFVIVCLFPHRVVVLRSPSDFCDG